MRYRNLLRRALVTAAVLGLFVADTTSASATYPGQNGDIAYLSSSGSHLAVRAIDPGDMSDHKLSIGDTAAADAEYVADGSAAVIVEYPGRRSRIVRLDLATSTRTVVLPASEAPSGTIFSIGVSPDDASIVFCSLQRSGWRLFTVGMDGSDLNRISDGTDDCHADWGVNGRIVATEVLDSGAQRIFSMLPDGSDRQTVISFPAPGHWRTVYYLVPSWSPNASQIVFGGQRNNRNSEVWIVDQDGTNLTNLTATRRRDEYGPLFSPSGSLVAFTRSRRSRRGFPRAICGRWARPAGVRCGSLIRVVATSTPVRGRRWFLDPD